MWCTKHRMKGLHTKQKSIFLRDYWTKSDGVLPKCLLAIVLSTQAICNFKLMMLKVRLYWYILYIIISPFFFGGGRHLPDICRSLAGSELGYSSAARSSFPAWLLLGRACLDSESWSPNRDPRRGSRCRCTHNRPWERTRYAESW